MASTSSRASTSRTHSSTSDDYGDTYSITPPSSCSPSGPSIQCSYADYYVADHVRLNISPSTTFYPRTSTETYMSEESDCDDDQYLDPIDPNFEVPEYQDVVESHLRPSDPTEFAKLFPSTKRLYIRHDDTTYDGNMNLRVDTETKSGPIQLFHLRMQDLKRREFSLRRYERSSGREVCHSTQTHSKSSKQSSEARPRLTRSVTTALATMVKRPEAKRQTSSISSRSNTFAYPKYERKDSGYGSAGEYDDDFPCSRREPPPTPTCASVVKLEFSNYAQVDVRRRKSRAARRYSFDYWGRSYVWKKVTEKHRHSEAVSFHLYRKDGGSAIAHIVPESQTVAQVEHDLAANNWVPPCTMWISDMKTLGSSSDVAEIIVATGLISLVDDCVHCKFVNKRTTPSAAVSSKSSRADLKADISSRAAMSSMFRRQGSSESKKDSKKEKDRPKTRSPLRQNRFVEAC